MSRYIRLLSLLLLAVPLASTAQSQNAAPQVTWRINHPLDEKLAAGASAAIRVAIKAVPPADESIPVGIGETVLPRAASETFKFAGNLAPWNDTDDSDDGRVLEADEAGLVIRVAGAPFHVARSEVVTVPEVLAQLNLAVDQTPADVDARLARAFAHQAVGDDGRAISDLSELIQQCPEVAEYHVLRATRHVSVDSEAVALADCSEAIKLNPQHSFAYFLRAQCWVAAKRDDDALSDLNACIRHDPGCYWAYIYRAPILGRRNKLPAALDDLKAAIKLAKNPKSNLRIAVAQGYLHLDRYEEALTVISDAIRQEPSDPELLLVRFEIHGKLDRPDAAREDLLQAAELPCEKLKTLDSLAKRLSEVGEQQRSRALNVRISQLSATSHDDIVVRGIARSRLGEFTAAIADFTRALEIQPDDVTTRYLRAMNHVELRHWDDAVTDFTRLLDQRPDNISCLEARSSCRLSQKNYGAALADLDRLVALKPDHAESHARRGWVLSEQREYKAAHDELKRAIEIDSKNATASRELTWLLATCPDETIRNGRGALKQAVWYVSQMDDSAKSTKDFRALAAAAAAAGDFEEATKNQELVVKSYRHYAKTLADHQDLAGEEARLELYKAKKPYIEPSEPLPAVTSK